MQIDFAHSDDIAVPTGAIAGILHDLWQPLTALECSLELALMPCSPAKARSLTAAALQAARRLHVLAIQTQQIAGLCHQYRNPRVLSLAEFSGKFGLTFHLADSSKQIYVDTDGLRAAFRRLGFGNVLRGSIRCTGRVIRIAIKLDDSECALRQQVHPRGETHSPATLVSALIEHLGGRITLSRSTAVIEFLTH